MTTSLSWVFGHAGSELHSPYLMLWAQQILSSSTEPLFADVHIECVIDVAAFQEKTEFSIFTKVWGVLLSHNLFLPDG